MQSLEQTISRVSRWARKARWLVAALVVSLSMASPVLAAPKKIDKESAPTKSYVLPYLIVMALVGVGIMTVCRPSRRKDKPYERREEDE
jgi:hypothetical protein